ncbi:MAG TPA: hypothetical protein VMY37_24355 [Thermoguttaceae bacterium]|nr:hypothetical protein [Thermoguttaceae bacterium]
MVDDQELKYLNLTPPAAIIENASATVTEIDTLGWDYCEIVVVLGATDIAMTALAVTESDTTGTGHANVTGLIYGTSTNIAGSTSALPSALKDDGIYKFEIDLRNRKRYLDVTATVGDSLSSGALAGTFLAIFAVLSRPRRSPDTAAKAGCSDILRV